MLSSGVVSTLAGQAGVTGSTNGVATNSRFFYPYGIALDGAGTFAVVVRMGGRGEPYTSITDDSDGGG